MVTRPAVSGYAEVSRGSALDKAASLTHQLRIIYQRKWIVLACAIVVPIIAGIISLGQSKAFSASAQVLLSNQDFAATLVGLPDTIANDVPDRRVETQAGLARVPEVARRTLAATGTKDMTPQQFLASSSVTPATNSDLLKFSVTAATPAQAAQLATAYAEQYTRYKEQLDTAAVNKALDEINGRLAQLQGSGDQSGIYGTLLRTKQSLQTMADLQTANAVVVREADGATQTQPRVARNVVLGFGLGLLLGVGLALLVNAFDSRISEDEIGERIGAPLLGRLPKPHGRVRRAKGLVMLEEPTGPMSEAFRILRTNLDFALLTTPPEVLLVTSAEEGEASRRPRRPSLWRTPMWAGGWSASGLDLRRPSLDALFSVPSATGLPTSRSLTRPFAMRLLAVASPEMGRALAWGAEQRRTRTCSAAAA